MHFFKAVTIPINTPISNPKVDSLQVDIPHISQVIIRIPPGVQGLAGVRLLDDFFPIVPANAESWVTGAEEIVSINMDYELKGLEKRIRIEGYNTDNTYDHTFYIHVITAPSVAEVRIVSPGLPGV